MNTSTSFLADFVDKLLSLGKIQVETLHGRAFVKDKLYCIHPPEATEPAALLFKTLLGMTGYLLERIDQVSHEMNGPAFLHVHDFNRVDLFGQLQPEVGNRRFLYASANLHAEAFNFGHWYDLETFIIAIQSLFVESETTNSILDVLGNLANEIIVENKDDGLSQSVQVKTGITTKSQVKITNPMTLRPFRTFREVEQPASQFIFRIRKKDGLQCALFESDGGKWKLEAITNIKAWLMEQLTNGDYAEGNRNDVVVIG